eukprot:CAMPEP_0172758628 /NCGR_PEP_ID=MMETSP1074-20121228/166102_1 /TAXON_ID=2916 /ORGANISM="Ceratium fusus, Strain PA161109" /LENGTH=33 /DNA_ID= /DNA_START= /DNA_END= /DNA_ORIENTATION=
MSQDSYAAMQLSILMVSWLLMEQSHYSVPAAFA